MISEWTLALRNVLQSLFKEVTLWIQLPRDSPVELAQKSGERGKNSNKDKFGIIRKQIFHWVTYLKSSKILLGEKKLYTFL